MPISYSTKRIYKVANQVYGTIPNKQENNECNKKSNTSCLGEEGVIVFNYTTYTDGVYPYATSIKPVKNVPIVSSETAYDNHVMGTTTIIENNKGLYFEKVSTIALLNQIRPERMQLDFGTILMTIIRHFTLM